MTASTAFRDAGRSACQRISGPFVEFLKAARGRSQEEIIIEFLASTVLNDSVSENGSVLINHPQKKVLITFNEGDFL